MSSEKTRVFFFGDSVCFGQHIAPHKIFVTRIFAQLEQSFPSLDIVGYNVSISGNTTRMALERIAYDLQPYHPDVVYVQFGMNDCNYWVTDSGAPRTGKRSFASNLTEIIERCRFSGAKTVLLGTNHISGKTAVFPHLPLVYQDQNVLYNEVIREVAGETDAVLVDHERAWNDAIKNGASLASLILPDGIHLAVPGHDLYFQTLMPHLMHGIAGLAAGTPISN
jgi:lysophospholipase L1-like esterase